VDVDLEKQAAAEAAVDLVEDGMTVGLGTGSTVAFFLPALAARKLRLRCVATSPATSSAATSLGLDVVPFAGIGRLDVAVDGADQVAPDGWLIKGGGGAHTREKVVAAAADRFVVVVSSNKLVDQLRPPIPVELLAFGLDASLALLGTVQLRGTISPDQGVLADWYGVLGDPDLVATTLSSVPGLVSHGLFPPALVSDVLVADGGAVEHRRPAASPGSG